MVLKYDIDRLNTVLRDFYLATGVNIFLCDESFSSVGVERHPHPAYCRAIQGESADNCPCKASDEALLKRCQAEKKMVMHRCHAGLLDVAAPILYEDRILGYIIFGQIKTGTDFSEVKEKIAHLHLNMEEMERYYGELPYINDERIRSIASIADILTRHIILENMLKPYLFSEIERVTAYIRAHLHETITVRKLCRETHLSTSVLYKRFHAHFGCTLNDYINLKRVEEARGLLENTDLSVEEISERVGFSGASYFSRIFKQKMGVSPIRFRKTKQGRV